MAATALRRAGCSGAFRSSSFAAAPQLARRRISYTPTMVSMEALRARQPPELLQTDVFRTVPPEDLTPTDLADLASREVMTNPAKVLEIYRRHVSSGVGADASVLIRAFAQLGFLFDPNSFFSTADKQLLTRHKDFRSLAHDLACLQEEELPDASAPLLLYSMASLEYRCAPLLPRLLRAVERGLEGWRTEALSLMLHSLASLGLGGGAGPVVFDNLDGSRSPDFSHICGLLGQELGRRAAAEQAVQQTEQESSSGGDEATLQDWSRAAFSLVMAGQSDLSVELASGNGAALPVLPLLLARACEQVEDKEHLDRCGWAQFFLYQTLYCVDVEKPACEEVAKRAMPMWIQEWLHHRWLDNVVLHAQPQGADMMQRDVDLSLNRTNTQALLNCSFGRDWDEQHCWFAGFMLEPKLALECDSMLPLGPGRPRPSGWLSLKSRILRKTGFKVVTLHECFWSHLSEDQKDEQIMRLRAEAGYRHNRELEKQRRKIRQEPHTYKGIETKRKEWSPQAGPPSDERAFA
eukprot:TRINITY_DN11980_c0_g5_i1.p1 TRINITY_DN11980_c0_g5~~TRINITY_DN11980_c0_g5_i1.p1  ORF type:complete len:531 (+),score=111.54 TRINITY_DN11980_c0_g5_i1:31-1593(+)